MAGCVEDNVCLRWTWVKVIILVCCYGSVVRGDQSPAKMVTGGNLTATTGGSVMFRCEVQDGEGSHITMVQWTRCDQGVVPSQILVFLPSGSQLSLDDTYQGRVTMTTASSFTLRNVSMEDFGLYCCKLNVFPDGVLQAEVHLSEKADQNPTLSGPPPQIVYILGGVVCTLVLVVVITTVIVCKKRRVQLYSNVSVQQGNVLKGPDDAGEKNDKEAEKGDDDDDHNHHDYENGEEDVGYQNMDHKGAEEDIDYQNVSVYFDP